MSNQVFRVGGLAATLLALALVRNAAGAAEARVGGWSEVAVTNEQVMAAAAFAVGAEQKAMSDPAKEPAVRLELVAVRQAAQQVVAGMNYRLRLAVKRNGEEQEAEAVVWWQAWRKPDPWRLTRWTWK